MSSMETNLNIEVVIHDADTAILTIGGELDIDTATSLHHHMANQFLHGRRHLVLDLSDLQFMDSSGLNVLIKAGREARDTGGDVHLAAPTPIVLRLFEITGLSVAMPIHSTVDEALATACSPSVPTADRTAPSAHQTDETS
ncbi:STAS domain-containing protein [Streptomyces sp. NBC_01794]|nr:STAS domain-containing protein [Streptomyces sp. NBC_01794]WSD30971.1 STAS domain-containing protein [Streptomyces sp. NBC_01750]